MINTWKTTCFAVAISALGTGAAMAQDAVFRANMPGNEDSIAYKSVERFDQTLNELTGGAVDIKLFANSALGDQESSLEAMQTGLLDMATIETPITSVVPELGATALPYIFSGRAHVARALDGEAGDQDRGNAGGQGAAACGLSRRWVPSDHQQCAPDQHAVGP